MAKKRIPRNSKIEVGNILIAPPLTWQNEDYRRAIILIIAHNKKGTMGIMVNTPTSTLLRGEKEGGDVITNIYLGGNEKQRVIHYIHNNAHVPDARHLGNEIFFGGDYETVLEMIDFDELAVSEIKFCAGHMHWKMGMLEKEITQNKWWIDEISPQELFSVDPNDLWAEKLKERKHPYAIVACWPDPSLN